MKGCLCWVGLAALLLCLTTLRAKEAIAADRPPEWAVKLEHPGLKNLHRVTPALYRSAQPTAEGMHQLEQLGIRTVISLRAFNSVRDEAKGTGLRLERIRFNTWHAEDAEVVRFLRLVAAGTNAPVLVHCQHGSDRTGTMLAIYRMAVQGWSKEQAIRELKEGGYGYHTMWFNLPRYLRRLDINRLKREAGLL